PRLSGWTSSLAARIRRPLLLIVTLTARASHAIHCIPSSANPAGFSAVWEHGCDFAQGFRTISTANRSAKERMPFATEPCRIASNGFAPDEPKMLDLRETDGLFEHFEVNREPFWPVISRLLGGSIVLHAVLGACILFIPAVRDALSV